MVLGANGVVWMGGERGGAVEEDEEDVVSSWTRNHSKDNEVERKEEEDLGIHGSLSTFKSMLETDWYINSDINPSPLQNHHEIRDLAFCSNPTPENLLLQPMDSSSSCSPSQAFSLDPSQSHHPFLPSKSCFSSLLNVTNPFDNGLDLGCESVFLNQFQQNQGSNLMDFCGPEFHASQLLSVPDNAGAGGFGNVGLEGFDGSPGNALFSSRAKVLRPLEILSQVGSPPTLFQKRAMLRQSGDKIGNLEMSGLRYGRESGGNWGEMEKKRKKSEESEIEEVSFDVSGLNYDSDEQNGDGKVEESVKNNGGSNSNANSTVTGGGGGGDQKGKKKGMPAKNLMAERRRRKRLNDRLYMLRSVVPKISKMDRASILGDAIDYLKELLQRINDLHNELESAPSGPLLPQSTSFHPLTPTPATLPCRVKEELCPSSLPSPKNQSARVEVRVREGRAVNIHMFCARRPGLLLSTMRALDNLGLDIQQAVISCFNGFALDVFRAEQCREGQDVLPEQIKAVLLDSAGFHGMV
ncbi:hypothetical protein JCGZ_26864 [Jatropha curcas]|uniref:Inducer of CBF expression 2 n=1 Tax=Jatropha curcas TaxID=180498 RepID=A0A067L072_JATCU|nr:transcription factor ICE1 [Jatropha curcas]AKE33031.1 inducer of CBF expression 2 [Jatropha curcas]KDP41846.1 hypothetical protein JCGZ_26864 [Jatropha curcas]